MTIALTIMPEVALARYGAYLALAFGLRTWLQWRQTGSTGFHGVGGLYAQLAMGNSWRIGVDHEVRTELVTGGPFAVVRNPIFSVMPTALGLTLMVPSVLAIVGFLGLLLALELQVRVVEEPYLLKAHGERFADYAAYTGRFFPGVGRLDVIA